MINLGTAKTLDRLGIMNLYKVGGGGTFYWDRDVSIKILLEKLPYGVDIHKGIMDYFVECRDIKVKHKNLEEALARLIIKLHKEKII